MNRYLYSLIFYLLIPFALLRLLYRSFRAPAYARRWAERFGFCRFAATGAGQPGSIWVHAVSVGETLAAEPLIRSLLADHPDRALVVTTMTPTGSERVRSLFGEQVCHYYLPYDLPGAMARFIRTINPALLIIMETELWPNLLHRCRLADCRTMLVNARLSEKSARGYRRFPGLARAMLAQLDMIAAQSQADVDRFVQLGATPGKIRVTGSLKFDMQLPDLQDSTLPSVFRQVADLARPVLVAASTREGEEEKVLSAFRECLVRQPELLLVLVPRHPERFNAVARLCEDSGLATVRRSSEQPCRLDTQVFLGDSMGEMWNYYRLADLAFVGGSLVDTGCHNVLEPAALGIPVLVGPSRFNFEAICNLLQEAGALITVTDEQDLARQVLLLLDDRHRRDTMGTAGKRIVDANRGSLLLVKELIEKQLTR